MSLVQEVLRSWLDRAIFTPKFLKGLGAPGVPESQESWDMFVLPLSVSDTGTAVADTCILHPAFFSHAGMSTLFCDTESVMSHKHGPRTDCRFKGPQRWGACFNKCGSEFEMCVSQTRF